MCEGMNNGMRSGKQRDVMTNEEMTRLTPSKWRHSDVERIKMTFRHEKSKENNNAENHLVH